MRLFAHAVIRAVAVGKASGAHPTVAELRRWRVPLSREDGGDDLLQERAGGDVGVCHATTKGYKAFTACAFGEDGFAIAST